MKMTVRARTLAFCIVTTAACVAVLFLVQRRLRALPYHDSFAQGSMNEWKAWGGDWSLVNGNIRNGSDERGAKLIAGSKRWKNYVVEADIMLLGQDGNAGLIIRSSDEERGVDSYTGYYSGLRTRDNALTLGRAGHEWQGHASARLTQDEKIRPFQWYHLALAAYECEIVAMAAPAGSRVGMAALHWDDKRCVPEGRIGLRSYSSGGLWRNVQAHELDAAAFAALRESSAFGIHNASASHSEPGIEPAVAELHPSESSDALLPRVPIGDLRLTGLKEREKVKVRGVVVLTAPSVFIQDVSGGVEVRSLQSSPLKIGDEVEATGSLEVDDLHVQLVQARVKTLWSQTPPPAVAVSAAQAATGMYDGHYVEVEGRVTALRLQRDGNVLVRLTSGPADFQALVRNGAESARIRSIAIGSVIRLKGVCVASPVYTSYLTPFAVLVRSGEEILVVSGPPWWSLAHIVLVLSLSVVFVFLATFLYSRVERWRLRAVFLERERLAQEMHDTLAQSFAGIGFQIEAIRHSMPQEFHTLHRQLDVATGLVRHSHEEARRSIAALRPEALESGELLQALQACAHSLVQGGSLCVTCATEGPERPIPLRHLDHFYRIGQEALANAISHAQANHLLIRLSYADEWIALIVQDDGVGFAADQPQRGFGLQGMRKRARAAGGTLQIESSSGGTIVTATAPLSSESRVQAVWRLFKSYIVEHRFYVAAK